MYLYLLFTFNLGFFFWYQVSKMHYYLLSFVKELWHFGQHLLVDGILCYFLGHRDRNYVVKCLVFSYLSVCASSGNLLWLKLIFCCLSFLFLRKNQLVYGNPNLVHELIHFSVTSGLHLWVSTYDCHTYNFVIGILFFILHLVWENDDAELQLFRYFMLIANFVHLLVWLAFGKTVACFMCPDSEFC